MKSLLELIDARHAGFNATLYQLEPDVKEAPGALRDLTAARTIAMLTDPLLLRRGPADPARVDQAEDFLLRVRSTLHLNAGRNQNTLSHEMQERTADLLGYPGAEPRQRVERLMSDYFRHARTAHRSLSWARKGAPVPVGPNLGVSRDGIRFLDPIQAARNPATWLGAFQAAIDSDTTVSEEALSCIQQHVDRFRADDFFPESADRAALLKLLKPRKGLYDRLSEMHDCGLLGRVFPEFQAISWRVVRDFYHKYTVDEHTLLTIRNLERISTTEVPYRLRFRNILSEIDRAELLVLALLLHDVGKWRDDDHALESVRMAMEAVERLDLDSDARETILFLIRHHLRMSLVAFRRDTEDPEIVKEFSAFVGSEERLKMLTLMTLVDVEAVSPETLTPWKEELLWRLYVDTYNHLTQRYGDEVIERNQAGLNELLKQRPDDLSVTEITRFLEGLPQRYLQLFARDVIYRHVRLARDIHPDEVHLSLERGQASVWSLAVATLDKPFLFSNICGVLSSFGMNIIRGHALTNPNGLVLDVFQFTDDERFLELNQDGQEQVLQVLEHVVSGRADVAARLRPREQGVLRAKGARRFPPVVRTDNQASGRYTILDIVATNALGLAVSDQPRDFPARVRRRSRAHRHRGREGDRRLSHHQGWIEAHRGGTAGADVRPTSHTGGFTMKLIKCIIRPNKVDEVKDALAKLSIAGMTVTEVRGHGKQKGHTAIYRGKEYNVSLLPKMEIEIVVPDNLADDVVKAVVQAARTGEIGDGRVFVLPVLESYRIRTGEKES